MLQKDEAPEVLDYQHMKVASFSALHIGRRCSPSRQTDTPGTHFFYKLIRPQVTVGSEGLSQ